MLFKPFDIIAIDIITHTTKIVKLNTLLSSIVLVYFFKHVLTIYSVELHKKAYSKYSSYL
jgi:hypothetical protein